MDYMRTTHVKLAAWYESLIDFVIAGSAVVWLGITFFLEQLGYLSTSTFEMSFTAGIGAIIVIQGFITYKAYRLVSITSFVVGAIVVIVGLTFASPVAGAGPLILIALGIAILALGVAEALGR